MGPLVQTCIHGRDVADRAYHGGDGLGPNNEMMIGKEVPTSSIDGKHLMVYLLS